MDATIDSTQSASPSPQSKSSRGGPGTVRGKSRSRGNAIKHGLTADRLASEVFRRRRVEDLTRQFEQQLQPKNIVEQTLVAEMARHTAMMEVGEKVEGAILRHGAMMLAPSALVSAADVPHAEDAVLCAAATTDAIERFARHRRSHERGFYSAWASFQNLRAAEAQVSPREVTLTFNTEEKCHAYLVDFRSRNLRACPNCGSEKRAYWAGSTNCFVCPGCDRQTGLRSGTVMESSPIPLKTWFAAIEAVLAQPTITVAELAERIGVSRRGTVRNMLQRIQTSIGADNCADLLVGFSPNSI